MSKSGIYFTGKIEFYWWNKSKNYFAGTNLSLTGRIRAVFILPVKIFTGRINTSFLCHDKSRLVSEYINRMTKFKQLKNLLIYG